MRVRTFRHISAHSTFHAHLLCLFDWMDLTTRTPIGSQPKSILSQGLYLLPIQGASFVTVVPHQILVKEMWREVHLAEHSFHDNTTTAQNLIFQNLDRPFRTFLNVNVFALHHEFAFLCSSNRQEHASTSRSVTEPRMMFKPGFFAKFCKSRPEPSRFVVWTRRV